MQGYCTCDRINASRVAWNFLFRVRLWQPSSIGPVSLDYIERWLEDRLKKYWQDNNNRGATWIFYLWMKTNRHARVKKDQSAHFFACFLIILSGKWHNSMFYCSQKIWHIVSIDVVSINEKKLKRESKNNRMSHFFALFEIILSEK